MKLQKRLVNLVFKIISWKFIPYLIVAAFSITYLTLSIVKHNHFLSGYDLSIIDQATWKYSQFKNPITTSHVYFDTPIYIDHLEIILILISPIYWIFDSVLVLIVLQSLAICSSGISVYKISRYYKTDEFLSYCILISYLSFFGIQFAIWSDVHSLVFGVTFLSWFLYNLIKGNNKFTLFFLILSIICKEDIALMSFLISITHYIFARKKIAAITAIISLTYLSVLFLLYFPNVVDGGYRYANPDGLLSDINLIHMLDTADKRLTIFYSLGWFGFVPLLSLNYLLPFLGDLGHYFVLGNKTVSATNIFMHYRVSVGLLLVWPTIVATSRVKKINKWYTGIYLLIFTGFFQYYLHLPLSYLSKTWFWHEPSAVTDIKKAISKIPKNASVASQINIIPHISHRDKIYTLFPSTKDFDKNAPCGQKNCKWFDIGQTPEFILVDTSDDWDVRHFLTTKEEFMERIKILNNAGVIRELFKSNNTIIFKTIGNI